MVGLFSKNKDPQKKANMEKFKEFKNLAKQKKVRPGTASRTGIHSKGTK